jgi:hypothetical protein
MFQMNKWLHEMNMIDLMAKNSTTNVWDQVYDLLMIGTKFTYYIGGQQFLVSLDQIATFRLC